MGAHVSRRRRSSIFPVELKGPRASTVSDVSWSSSRSPPFSEAEAEDTADIKALLCGADSITSRGKQVQMIQMLTIPLVPAFLLMIHSCVYLSASLTLEREMVTASQQVVAINYVADIMHSIQEERFALILISLDNDTIKSYEAVSVFNATDSVLHGLGPWPGVLSSVNVTDNFLWSRDNMVATLEKTRDAVSRLGSSQIMEFYDKIISLITLGIDELARRVTSELLWRKISGHISLEKGVEVISDFSAVSEIVYAHKNVNSPKLGRRLLSDDVIASGYIREASVMSSLIARLYGALNSDQTNPTPPRRLVRAHTTGRFSGTTEGRGLLNKTLNYLDALRAIGKISADDNLNLAGNERRGAERDVAAAITLLITTLVSTPVIFVFLTRMVGSVQRYALGLYKHGVNIRREKKKSDDLLYQMLPKSVALQLKVMKRTTPESFRSVTLFFSDIVGFTALSSRSTPLQVVECLNAMYNLFDATIAKYDVFKVETIGDAYMVASGVPQRNGMRHAGQIAQLSLDLLEGIRVFRIPHRPEEKLRIRIGIHTGAVVAGVVGSKMPRYCLFGDTVSYASLMESNGLPMKIQLSFATHHILEQLGTYLVEPRGTINIQGYGEIETYFLRGRVLTQGGRP